MSFLDYFTRLNERALLMEAMIATLGLSETMDNLPDHRNVHRRATTRCLSCEFHDECALWLANNDTADEAPYYCKNHDLFDRMMVRQLA